MFQGDALRSSEPRHLLIGPVFPDGLGPVVPPPRTRSVEDGNADSVQTPVPVQWRAGDRQSQVSTRVGTWPTNLGLRGGMSVASEPTGRPTTSSWRPRCACVRCGRRAAWRRCVKEAQALRGALSWAGPPATVLLCSGKIKCSSMQLQLKSVHESEKRKVEIFAWIEDKRVHSPLYL